MQSEIHNTGRGPSQVKVNSTMTFPWSVFGDWFGAGNTSAYFARVYEIGAGDTGLTTGQSVQLSFRIDLDGSLETRALLAGEVSPTPSAPDPLRNEGYNYTNLYVAQQVFRISSDEPFVLPEFRRVNFFNRETETLLGYVTPGLELLEGYDGQVLSRGSGSGTQTVDYHSTDHTVDMAVGDRILVETYCDMFVGLPTHASIYEHYSVDGDFDNTMTSPINFGQAFEGLELIPISFNIPEPATFILLAIGGLILIRRR